MSASGALRNEVLSLYREILRTSRIFKGQRDSNGVDWMPRLVESARQEFQSARDLTEEVEISRRIVVGRDALYQIQGKVGDRELCKAYCYLSSFWRILLTMIVEMLVLAAGREGRKLSNFKERT